MAASCRPFGINITRNTVADVATKPNARQASLCRSVTAKPHSVQPNQIGIDPPIANPMYVAYM